MRGVAHHGHGGVNFTRMRGRAGGNGIKTRGKTRQHGNQVCGIVNDAGELHKQVEKRIQANAPKAWRFVGEMGEISRTFSEARSRINHNSKTS